MKEQKDVASRIVRVEIAFYQKNNRFRSKIDLKFKKQFVKTYVWGLYGSATRTVRK